MNDHHIINQSNENECQETKTETIENKEDFDLQQKIHKDDEDNICDFDEIEDVRF